MCVYNNHGARIEILGKYGIKDVYEVLKKKKTPKKMSLQNVFRKQTFQTHQIIKFFEGQKCINIR